MANAEWLEIYRSYSPEKLAAEIVEIEAEKSVYVSQGIGNKNYTKDLGEIRGKLSAAVRVQNERASRINQSSGVVSFRDL